MYVLGNLHLVCTAICCTVFWFSTETGILFSWYNALVLPSSYVTVAWRYIYIFYKYRYLNFSRIKCFLFAKISRKLCGFPRTFAPIFVHFMHEFLFLFCQNSALFCADFRALFAPISARFCKYFRAVFCANFRVFFARISMRVLCKFPRNLCTVFASIFMQFSAWFFRSIWFGLAKIYMQKNMFFYWQILLPNESIIWWGNNVILEVYINKTFIQFLKKN